MPVIFSFLGNYWKQLAIAGVLIAVFVYIEILRTEIITRDAQIVTLTDNNSILKSDNVTLTSSINAANASINKFDAFAATTNKNFQDLNKKIGDGSIQLTTKLQTILKETKPATCTDTIKYLIDARTGYTQ